MKAVNGTKNKVIRKEFVAIVKASFPRVQADSIISKAKSNGFDESYCFSIYEEAMSYNL